jgi:hypothetical protein
LTRYSAEWAAVDCDSAALRALIGASVEPLDVFAEIQWTADSGTHAVAFPIQIVPTFNLPEDAPPDPTEEASWTWLKARLAAGTNVTFTDNDTTQVRTISASGGGGGGGGGGGSVDWGDIDGTLSDQTDLQTALNNKQPLASALTTLSGATAAGLALMDDANAAAQRTTLGLGIASSPDFNSVNLSSGLTVDGASVVISSGAISITGPMGAGTYQGVWQGDAVAVAYGGTGASTASGARATLGLGNASTLNVGTTAGTVAAGNDSRLSDARTPTAHAASHVTGGTDAIQSATASQPGLATAAQITKLDGIEALADVTDAANVGIAIHGATAKTTPVDADTVPLIDSAASNALKKLSWTNIKATLKTYFDALYVTGPSSANDNALVRYDGTTGKLVQNSAATITDTGTLTVSSADAQVVASSAVGDMKLESSVATLGMVWQFDPGVEGFGVQTVKIKANTGGTESFDLILPQEVGTVGQVLAISWVSAPDVNLIWASPAGGGDALTTNPLSQFAATTSSQLAGVISDETGSGALVFANSPTLVTPALGTPASGVLTNCTGLPISGLASFVGLPVSIQLACSDEGTALTTGTAKLTFRMPHAMTLTAVRASVGTAPTGSTLVVDINEGGDSILGTKLSIDATEKTSTTAASAATITDATLADDAEITIDIDQIGSTIAGAGLKVTLIGTRA